MRRRCHRLDREVASRDFRSNECGALTRSCHRIFTFRNLTKFRARIIRQHEANASNQHSSKKQPAGPCESTTHAALTSDRPKFPADDRGTCRRSRSAEWCLSLGRAPILPGHQSRILDGRNAPKFLRRIISLRRHHIDIRLAAFRAGRSVDRPARIKMLVCCRSALIAFAARNGGSRAPFRDPPAMKMSHESF